VAALASDLRAGYRKGKSMQERVFSVSGEDAPKSPAQDDAGLRRLLVMIAPHL
jgi:hypothetical protein